MMNMFTNACMYNPRKHDVYDMSLAMMKDTVHAIEVSEEWR